MQLLKIDKFNTLSDLADAVGDRNVDTVLATNGLTRTPNIKKAFQDVCEGAIAQTKEVTWQAKTALLNTVTGDADIFESASLLDDDGWRLFDSIGALPGTLKIPESIKLPDSVDVIGGSDIGISNQVYKRVMDSLASEDTHHSISPEIFNDFSSMKPVQMLDTTSAGVSNGDLFTAFPLPWGKITLASSLTKETVDFPVYPEELEDSAKASYDTMPEVLYQYEPWYTYKESGPRDMTYTFHFHRDMWTGDHRDGKANRLIRFCEANCYPQYNGSAVNTAVVTLYINGVVHISGIMTEVGVNWKGPLGLDDWYLECDLTLHITEVARSPKNFDSVKSMSLIGG